jgi:hypothetical protein
MNIIHAATRQQWQKIFYNDQLKLQQEHREKAAMTKLSKHFRQHSYPVFQ